MEPLLPERAEVAREVAGRHRERLLRLISEGAGTGAPPPGPRIPGYRLLRVLGEGAVGTVWEAEDLGDGGRVAIKLLRGAGGSPTGDAQALTRELRASERVEHRGIARIRGVLRAEDGGPALLMDLVPGVDLGRLLAAEGPLPWSRACPLLLQLCEALACAHDRGVIHRDLKPTNIMVQSTPEGERCTVVDLGLSRLLGDSVMSTLEGGMVGTPAYMSPEQVRGTRVDGRADIYALGCIAYEMLAGRRPFPGTTAGELAVQHLLAEPSPLQWNGPREVAAIVRRALAKDPRARFPDMRSFAGALARVGAARPVRSRAAWAGGAMMLGLAGGLAFYLGGGSSAGEASPSPLASPAMHPPAAVPVPPRIIGVTTGIVNTCVVAENGLVNCWGADSVGRLGRGTDGEPIGDNEWPADRPPLGLREVVRVETAPNARHICVIDRDRRLRCWGRGSNGALGRASTRDFGDDIGETLDTLGPLPLREVVDLALSTQRTCAVALADGHPRLHCWGSGEFGALGSGSTADVGDDGTLDGLAPVPLGADVLDVTAGNSHTCALLATGAVRCWGSDRHGQLGIPGWSANIGDGVGDGHGRGRVPDDPTLDVHGLGDVDVIAIDAAGDRSCALTRAGGVRCWGSNEGAALGHGGDDLPNCPPGSEAAACDLDAPLPFDIDLGDLRGAKVVALTCGQRHTCVLDDRGRVRCWGEVLGGKLGGMETEDIGHDRSPGEVWARRGDSGVIDIGDADGDGIIDRAVEVDAGMLHTCVITEAGGVRCWGHGGEGRLGYASSDNLGITLTPGDQYAIWGVHDIPVFAP